MARSWATLQRLSDDELVAEHDESARVTQIGTAYYLDELRHRRQGRVASRVEKFTQVILWLTVVVTVATIVNVGLVVMAQ